MCGMRYGPKQRYPAFCVTRGPASALARHQSSVFVNAGFDMHARGVTGHGFETLFDGMSQTHRTMRFPRQGDRERLGFNRQFAAITAAEIWNNNAYFV